MKFYIEELIEAIPSGFTYSINGMIDKAFVTNALPTLMSNKESITFIDKNRSREEKQNWIKESQAKLIISDIDIPIDGKVNIFTNEPKVLFSYLVNKFFVKKEVPGIHHSAIISKNSKIGKGSYVGPNTIIRDYVVIGENCNIYGNVTINDRTTIGNNVKIQSGTVIAGEGFGYLKSDKLGIINFPHIGGVILEDNVEVGANNTIDRGALSNTILRKDVKTDSLVHIAHNVVIGENTVIAACVGIAGSSSI